MKNSVYVRSKKSILTISLSKLVLILPLIFYGFYKNGISLYVNGYTTILGMFKPLVIILGSALIGCLVNILYEKVIKKKNESIKDMIFSSFHLEYAVFIACLMPIKTNLIIYFITLCVLLFLSKFIKNRINIMSVIFIVIYILEHVISHSFNYLNNYEMTKEFSLSFFDYFIGKGSGGIASTSIILILIALIGLYITNNNKNTISLYAYFSLIILSFIGYFAFKIDLNDILFLNNYIFIFTFVATDSVTSCYTKIGMKVFGILVGIITFCLYFVNPILAPYIAIMVISLFNNLLDRKLKVIENKGV